jgi:glycosyltransferase involved in cell wall biosynthesis
LILFLGRLNFKKGLDLLIPSFSKLLEHVPNAHLAIVGPDNEGYGTQVRQWCRDYGVEQQVHFVDHLPAEEVREAYVDADVFALTSYTENFGMTIAEAMACECPVVISDQVNIWREVQEASAGVVVPLDVDQITSALRSVLEDVEQAKRMGQAGRALVREKYAWDKINIELIETYSDLIEGKIF